MRKRITASLLSAILIIITCYNPVFAIEYVEGESETVTDAIKASVAYAKPGIDYPENIVMMEADSEAEANMYADRYSELTGITATVEGFAYGIATLHLSKKDDNCIDGIDVSSTDSYGEAVRAEGLSNVADFTIKAAELAEKYNLPLVEPDYYVSIDEEELLSENYSDEYLNPSSNKYQFFHSMIHSDELFALADAGELEWWPHVSTIEENEDGTYTRIKNAENVVVAVLDTGIYEEHDDFYYASLEKVIGTDDITGEPIVSINYIEDSVVVGGKRMIEGDEDNYKDDNGHGSHVAGIIAGKRNGMLGRGVASGVNIMPVKVLNSSGSGYASDIIKGINYVVESGYNVKVINISIGGRSYSKLYEDAIDRAVDTGITVVASAGNSNNAGYNYPGSYDSAIAVGSVTTDRIKSDFSNYGEWVDIAAPGGNTKDSYTEDGAYKSNTEKIYSCSHTMKNAYVGKGGTSMAAPVVAGVAALIYARNSSITPREVEDIIKATAESYASLEYIGVGIVNAKAAVLSDYCNACDQYLTKVTAIVPERADLTEDLISRLIAKKLILKKQREYATVPVVNTAVDLSEGIYITEASVGSTIRIKANIIPEAAADKSVKYIVSDTTAASIDKSGQMKIHAMPSDGRLYVDIIAKDGSGVSSRLLIKVCNRAERIDINYDGDRLYLKNGEAYDLSEITCIKPSDSRGIMYLSTDERVTMVDNSGRVITGDSGEAKIYAVASDGSNVYSAISVCVDTKVESIRIVDSDGRGYAATGKAFCPKIVFNDGKWLPDNTKINWSVAEDKDKVISSINKKTGIIKLKSTKKIKNEDMHIVKLRAEYAADKSVSAEYELKVYPLTTGFEVQKRIINIVKNTKYSLDELGVIATPLTIDNTKLFDKVTTKTAGKYKYTSSRPSILTIDEHEGTFKGVRSGSAVIRILADDGSEVEEVLIVNITDSSVVDKLNVYEENNAKAICPGTARKYLVDTEKGDSLGNALHYGYAVFYDDNIDHEVLDIDASGKVTMNSKGFSLSAPVSARICYGTISGNTISVKASSKLMVYPEITKKISIDKKLTIGAGDRYLLKPESLPEGACQNYYTYKSSKPEIATVNTDGTIIGKKDGKTVVTVTAGDGSGISTKIKVTVKTPVRALTVYTNSGENALTAGESLKLKTLSNVNGYPSVKYSVKWKLSDNAKGYAKINSKGVVKAIKRKDDFAPITIYATAINKAKYTGDKAGINLIDNHVAGSVAITIYPKKTVSVNRLYIESNEAYVASGCRLKLRAYCNADATDKGITWSVADADKAYAAISNKGVLTAKKDINERHEITVMVTAKDEGKLTVAKKLTVCPKLTSLSIVSETGAKSLTMPVGTKSELTVSTGSQLSYNSFSVSTKGSSARVIVLNDEGTKIKVVGTKKGTTVITVKALDGSGKKKSFKVKVR